MRRLVLFAVLLTASHVARAWDVDAKQLWSEANGSFQSGKYEDAASKYQLLVTHGISNADVLFNLGTAQLRAGHRGAAILAYERALRLSPSDADVAFNLEEATKGNVDKIVGVREEEPLTERLGARIPEDTAGWIFIASWLLCWGAIILRLLKPRAHGALVATAIVTGSVAIIAGSMLALSAWVRTSVRYAVVVSQEASVREGPAKTFKAAFEVHEGLKVRVVDQQQDFLRIRLPNGVEGWVSDQDAPLI